MLLVIIPLQKLIPFQNTASQTSYFIVYFPVLQCVIGSVVNYEKDPCGTASEHVYGIIKTEDSSHLAVNVRHATRVIEQAFEKYK